LFVNRLVISGKDIVFMVYLNEAGNTMALDDDSYNLDEQTGVAEEIEIKLPPEYKVVLFNDDYTTKDFVVEVLEQVFHKNVADAIAIMESVHHTGSGVAGVYTYDIAATRASLTEQLARERGFPLRCEAQPC